MGEFVEGVHAYGEGGLHHAEGFPHGEVVAKALIGAGDDGVADGLAFCGVGVEEGRRCVTFEDEGDFPGEVEGVLDAGVGAEAVEGWVAVDGVAEAEAGCVSVDELGGIMSRGG